MQHCKKEIKQLNEALVAGTGFPEFSFRERCGKLIITFFEETQASSTQDDRIVPPSSYWDYHVLHHEGSPLMAPFSFDLHTSRMNPSRASRLGSGVGRREESNAYRFHNTASETTAQFLVIGLWIGYACRGKQGK